MQPYKQTSSQSCLSVCLLMCGQEELTPDKELGLLYDGLKTTDPYSVDGVKGATQSFVHALISDPIREFRDVAFDNLAYMNANESIREIISIVYRYMQESLDNVRNE